jgi:hypothetical protein
MCTHHHINLLKIFNGNNKHNAQIWNICAPEGSLELNKSSLNLLQQGNHNYFGISDFIDEYNF